MHSVREQRLFAGRQQLSAFLGRKSEPIGEMYNHLADPHLAVGGSGEEGQHEALIIGYGQMRATPIVAKPASKGQPIGYVSMYNNVDYQTIWVARTR
jgi:hypothetical protein